LLNIDNKISPLSVWRYTSKPLCYRYCYSTSNKSRCGCCLL